MSEEIKKILEKGENKSQVDDKSTDINNLNSSLEEEKKKRIETEKQLNETVFENSFEKLNNLYPHAKDFKDEIKKKVDAGYSVDDAVIATLQKENKLMTAEQIQKAENKGQGFGGSAATGNLDKSNTGEKTLAEYEQEFKDAEARGEIKLV